MLRIKTPATSANLSVGFDTLGMAFNLYNTYSFKKSEKMKLRGFFKAKKENLLVWAYKELRKPYAVPFCPVEITLEEAGIPVAKGLGSSASCILAGVLASNHFHELHIPFKECIDIAARLEGHPDNVFACAYGGLTAAALLEGGYHFQAFPVNDNYRFYMFIPDASCGTKASRGLLPEQITLADAVHNLSRMIFLPKAFVEGDIRLLRGLLQDRWHERYRRSYIPLHEEITRLAKRDDIIVCLSGAGPSLLVIADKDIMQWPEGLSGVYDISRVCLSNGLVMEEYR